MDKMISQAISVSIDPERINEIIQQAKKNKEEIIKDEQVYFDESKNKQTKQEYYASVNFSDPANSTAIEKVMELIQSTHNNFLRYDPSLYVYPWVDLRPDGKLQSIYSGEIREPEDVIQEDYAASQKREQEIRANKDEGENLLKVMAEAVTTFKYNCEHAVPQSWYDAQEPMRGDLHHLFTCEPLCNSIRSNYPYHDFHDYPAEQEAGVLRIEDQCGKAEDELFEPEFAKGTVARAMLYFLVRYPDGLEMNQKERIDVDLMLDWHRNEPPEVYELHRNQAIFELQGNRNPFIDYPVEMAELLRNK
ncbi:endonuclease I family protein [Halobacillus aidingensis]|uniref:Endonuclease I n=1 Tax=Halobacillus aidingensis TaxID=240303 RepID=A0A1H0J1I1_HALAD|nr:endonuclease [Halobacillus aidingensis]SDO37289.1 Endonuclease I [Halobacillus aidingensis]